MSKLLDELKIKKPELASKIENKDSGIQLILNKIVSRFPDYTDHSLRHSTTVMEYCEYLIEDITDLSDNELYILLHACILHDVGMAVTDAQLGEYCKKENIKYSDSMGAEEKREIIREHHHVFSALFINEEWLALGIPTERHAKAIALVAQGHRKVEFEKDKSYSQLFPLKSGSEKVRIAYLSAILRMADEFDITSERTPELYCKHFTPNNKISQDEFKKHLSTNHVFFEIPGKYGVTIEFTCTDMNLYNVLKSMVEKIRTKLNYCQKTLDILNLPKLKTDYIEEDFKPIGFEPISIKFGMDNERIFKTLIGKNLYKDKFVAIRECIQNCIDACRYKKQHNPKYEPEIIVSLQDNELHITDNGIGMDKYVIENYFATIGKSFYIHDVNSSSDYKSIGQFGIGVASYFLICDEFHMKTCKDNETLDFKVTDKFDEYFYFNTSDKSNDEGTTIIFNLTDEGVKEFTYDFLFEQIGKTFRFCDIPIILKKDGEKDITLSQEQFNNSSIKKTFESGLKPYFKENSKLFRTHNVQHKDELIEASCGFVFSLDNHPVDVLNYPNSIDTNMRQWFLNGNGNYTINLYHQGVYIKSIQSTSLFKNIVGDINILEKTELKLDRSDFGLDTELKTILSELEIKLLEKLKSIMKSYPLNISYSQIYELILFLYITNIPQNNEIYQFPEQMQDILMFIHYNIENSSFTSYDYRNVQNIPDFCIFINTEISDTMKTKICQHEYFFICFIPNTIKLYMNLFYSLGYSIELVESVDYCYLKFNKNSKTPLLFNQTYIVPFENSNVILSYVDKTQVWNLNNNFIKWAFDKKMELKDNDDIYKVLMDYLTKYFFYVKFTPQNISQISLSKINIMLDELNTEHNTDFKATRDWFPHWVQKGIID